MMTPAAAFVLLTGLQKRGATLCMWGDRLIIGYPDGMLEAERQVVSQHRQDIEAFVGQLQQLPQSHLFTGEQLPPKYHRICMERKAELVASGVHPEVAELRGMRAAVDQFDRDKDQESKQPPPAPVKPKPAVKPPFIVTVMTVVRGKPLPPVADRYDDPRLRELVGLCAELHASEGGMEFFVTHNQAAEAIGVSSKVAGRMLGRLCDDGILIRTMQGSPGNGSRYRYLAKEQGQPAVQGKATEADMPLFDGGLR